MIDVVFHIINFLIFIGLMVYLFRRYAYSSIKQAMVLESTERVNLLKRYEHLRKQEQGCMRVYHHQNSTYEELSHKIAQWCDAVARVEGSIEADQEQIVRAIEIRSQKQRHCIAQETVCRSVIPYVLQDIERDMRQIFADPSQVESYTQAAIQRMRKEEV